MPTRPFLYLAEYPPSGRALFRKQEDARWWCDYQLLWHRPGLKIRWVSGGEHGWHAQRWDGMNIKTDVHGSITTIRLDGTLPDWRDDQDD